MPAPRVGEQRWQEAFSWRNKLLLTKFSHRKSAYQRWKWQEMTREKYRDTVQTCRGGIKTAKAPTELNLASNVKGNKKGCDRSSNSKIRSVEKVSSFLNGPGDLMTKDKLRYSVPSSPSSLLVRPVFSSSKSLRTVGKSGVRKA